jgi:hypothetical protein
MLPLAIAAGAASLAGSALGAAGARREARRRRRALNSARRQSAAIAAEEQGVITTERDARSADLGALIGSMGAGEVGDARGNEAAVQAEAARLAGPDGLPVADDSPAGQALAQRLATRRGEAGVRTQATQARGVVESLPLAMQRRRQAQALAAQLRSAPYAARMRDLAERRAALDAWLGDKLGDTSRSAQNMQLAGQGLQIAGSVGSTVAGGLT